MERAIHTVLMASLVHTLIEREIRTIHIMNFFKTTIKEKNKEIQAKSESLMKVVNFKST